MYNESGKIAIQEEPILLETLPDKMIRVEGGVFAMGSEDSEAYDWEKPVHQVKLDGFCITSWSSKR